MLETAARRVTVDVSRTLTGDASSMQSHDSMV